MESRNCHHSPSRPRTPPHHGQAPPPCLLLGFLDISVALGWVCFSVLVSSGRILGYWLGNFLTSVLKSWFPSKHSFGCIRKFRHIVFTSFCSKYFVFPYNFFFGLWVIPKGVAGFPNLWGLAQVSFCRWFRTEFFCGKRAYFVQLQFF